MSIVIIVSASPTIDRIEPMIVNASKATLTGSEGSGAFTFCSNTKKSSQSLTDINHLTTNYVLY